MKEKFASVKRLLNRFSMSQNLHFQMITRKILQLSIWASLMKRSPSFRAVSYTSTRDHARSAAKVRSLSQTKSLAHSSLTVLGALRVLIPCVLNRCLVKMKPTLYMILILRTWIKS